MRLEYHHSIDTRTCWQEGAEKVLRHRSFREERRHLLEDSVI